ncbi:1-acyl-sn-glycerol-3-phosphate acyltransferase [Mucilaginibacter sp. HC2]|uniref:lysophospholipid acyltransferase family protein n=1 Tax=Mucilaginibacter inviolabilis TaxID=2714892 RepID=UPI00140A99CF|nr:lysophospholipid acyltransferase family protein [Mucilaginibacter inviolabilis]NHA03894.1 1-acyl-sn-glycerol-3-phosphate acyltransferase [Mucilaginibacter inviolabilis]
MKLALKRIHTYFYQYSVGFFFILFWPVLFLLSKRPKLFRYINKLRQIIAFISSASSGIFYRATFEEPIDWSRTYVICPNHTSNLDVSAISVHLRNNHCFMGKEELRRHFVLKFFFNTIDITVNRESKMSSFRAFKQASEKLKNGVSVVIFPEGTIPDNYPPALHAFKNGPFRLAIEMKVPIIPVTSLDTWKVLWDTGKEFGSRPGICDIFVHKPIETAHLTLDDADALRDEVHAIIKQKLLQA